MNPIEQFYEEREQATDAMQRDEVLRKKSIDWMIHADKYKYTYNFSWLGRPIIKFPSDILIAQEIIWNVKPDLIVETGIAHGGSLIFSASMMELLGGKGHVLGIDIDIREHNKVEIEAHPLSNRITMIEGSSVDKTVFERVTSFSKKYNRILVFLDSLHTHEHVLAELVLYSEIVSIGSYIILPDTFIEYFPDNYFSDRPWNVGNNPKTALMEFLGKNSNFQVDRKMCNKLMITEAFDGYIKRVT